MHRTPIARTPLRWQTPASLLGASRCTLDDYAPPLYLIEFDAESFHPQAFTSASVDCPASVARIVRKRQAEFLFGRLAARLALSLAEATSPALAAAGIAIDPFSRAGMAGWRDRQHFPQRRLRSGDRDDTRPLPRRRHRHRSSGRRCSARSPVSHRVECGRNALLDTLACAE